MDGMMFSKGQRVVSNHPDGEVIYRGVVDVQRRGWVMVDLDEPCQTPQGWQASRIMLKATTLALEKD